MTNTRIIRFGLLLLSAGMIIFGISSGEHMDVLKKAVTICLECIGVG